MRVTEKNRAPRIIEVGGDPLRCLDILGQSSDDPRPNPRLFVIGIDAHTVQTKAGFAALLRRQKRSAPTIPTSVSHVIVVIDQAGGLTEPWMLARIHRWASSIHRRIQRARGIDTDVTVVLVDSFVDPVLIVARIEELAQRPPGVNPAAVLTADEIRGQTIAQASTNDFI